MSSDSRYVPSGTYRTDALVACQAPGEIPRRCPPPWSGWCRMGEFNDADANSGVPSVAAPIGA